MENDDLIVIQYYDIEDVIRWADGDYVIED